MFSGLAYIVMATVELHVLWAGLYSYGCGGVTCSPGRSMQLWLWRSYMFSGSAYAVAAAADLHVLRVELEGRAQAIVVNFSVVVTHNVP